MRAAKRLHSRPSALNATPYAPSGNTALLGANLLYEMLCVLPGVRCR
jgi:hypothetical protein